MDNNQYIELAKGAYHAYGETTDHKNYQGLPMPQWEDLTDKIRSAWIAAVKYIEAQYRNEKPMQETPDHR